MIRRRCLIALPLLLLAQPALASGGGGQKQVGQYVDLQPVAVPLIIDDRLVNYVFVNVRLNLAANADTSRWRAKEPYFRDALVRLSHRIALGKPGSTDEVDTAKLTAMLKRQATAITGPGVVSSVVVTSQTPSRRGGRRPI